MAHRGDHRKTITRVRHMEVSDERIEALSSNTFQSFCHAGDGDYIKSFAFQCHNHHCANRIIVITSRTLCANVRSVGLMWHYLVVTNSDSVAQVYFQKCIKLNSCSKR